MVSIDRETRADEEARVGQEMMVTGGSSDPGESAEGLGLISDCRAALLHNGLGRYSSALMAAERACKYPQEMGFLTVVLPELIEAASRSGRTERAARALERLKERTRAAGTDWALGIEARSAALISEGEVAEHLYREAIERLGRTPASLDLARAHLLYGEWLRRENRRIEARGELRMAHEMFVEDWELRSSSSEPVESYWPRAKRRGSVRSTPGSSSPPKKSRSPDLRGTAIPIPK